MAAQKVVVEGSYGVTASQLKDFFRQIEDGTIDGLYMQAVLEHRIASVQKSAPTRKSAFLIPCAEFKIGPLEGSFDPRAFWTTRKGLYIWGGLAERLLQNAKVVESSGEMNFVSYRLTENVYDYKIKAELAADHEVELWHIAKLIKDQPHGEDGPLLACSHVNIFYVAGGVVYVGWRDGDREWVVSDRKLDAGPWFIGSRIFSRN